MFGHVNQFGLSPGSKYFIINNKPRSRHGNIFRILSVWDGIFEYFAYWKYRVLGMELELEKNSKWKFLAKYWQSNRSRVH